MKEATSQEAMKKESLAQCQRPPEPVSADLSEDWDWAPSTRLAHPQTGMKQVVTEEEV